jgi:hypothetical protein
MKFGPKMKSAHGPLAQNPLRAPGRQAARSRNGLWPALPQTSLPVPGRHAARDGKWSTSPHALSASRTPGRNLGLGRERLFPPGLNLGSVIVSHPSQSDGCTRFPAKQNRLRLRRANPSLISLLRSLLRAAAGDSERPTSGGGESAPEAPPEPLAGVRAHRWVNAPPSSGLCGASTRSLAPTKRRATARRQGSSPAQIHKRSTGEILGSTTHRRAVVGFYPRSPQIHNLWICGRR